MQFLSESLNDGHDRQRWRRSDRDARNSHAFEDRSVRHAGPPGDVDRSIDRFDECGNSPGIAQTEGINTIRASRKIGFAALDRRRQARRFLPRVEMKNIATRVDHNGNALSLGCLSRGSETRGRILDSAELALE